MLRHGLLTVVVSIAAALLAGQSSIAQSAKPARGTPVATPTADAGDVQALAKFHARLAQFETDKSGNFSRLNLLQIGDSHTAADHISGRLRNLLQARFGNGGRGFMPPGAPHAWYRPYQVSVTQGAGWKTLSSNKTTPDPGLFGLSGFIAEARMAGETMTIEARSGADSLAVGYRRKPGGGSFEIWADGAMLGSMPTQSTLVETVQFQQSIGRTGGQGAGLPLRLEIKAVGDGPVEITDFSLWHPKGIRLGNIGFIGAQVSIMARWDWPTVRQQLADMDPALIILAFGTNEGHAPVANIEGRYARQLEERIVELKAAAPNASIVVVGTPDANRYPKFCLPQVKPITPDAASASVPNGEISPAPVEAVPATPPQLDAASRSKSLGAKPAPPPEPPANAICRPLDQAERGSYDQMLADKDRRLCRWHTPPAIPVVRVIQREVAARQGALFFDWFAVFETECGADTWFRRGLAHKDRVHFKQDEYWRVADLLHARLLAGYPPQKR